MPLHTPQEEFKMGLEVPRPICTATPTFNRRASETRGLTRLSDSSPDWHL
jgi:hypothetical protein